MTDSLSVLAQLARIDDATRLIRLDAPVAGLVVERFSGVEGVCTPTRFAIDCLSTSAFIVLDDLLEQPLVLHLAQADGSARQWTGLCTEAMPLGSDGGLARYRLILEPWTALLRYRRNALIFQDTDTRGVIEQLLADYPMAAFRFDVTRTLPMHAIRTQYKETDWEFVTRLLAEDGLAWRWEEPGGEGSTESNATSSSAVLVMYDQQAEVPAGSPDSLRFHRIDATEDDDAISAFAAQRQLVPNASHVGSWHTEQVATAAGEASVTVTGLPALEVFVQPRAGRFATADAAQAQAEHRLDALRVAGALHHGAGSARGLTAGHAFTLLDHPSHGGQAFVPLVIDHRAVNNLGSGIAALLGVGASGAKELDRGSYRNRFVAVPADTAIAPLARPRPTVHGPQTARVVGEPDSALTTTRDHQVRVQFAWQRGVAPNAGGRSDTASTATGHAPGDHTTGTWVPVAEWLSGPNWGSHFLPRIDSEVLVEFLHGDIDAPRITGQLYNGQVPPPLTAGHDSPANHPGTLSGLHTSSLDGSGTQQWALDDAPGQLRQWLHTSLADTRLTLGYLVGDGTSRGARLGEGVALTTQGWGNVHAAQGLLLSTTARSNATSTQLDVTDTVAQLKGAEQTVQRLHDALTQQQVPGLAANARLTELRETVDPAADGKYSGSINGQSAMKPAAGSRDPGQDPVERFARPVLLAESPDRIALTTPKSALAWAGGDLHLTVQDDAQLTAAQTFAGVSGGALAVFAHAGPLRTIAAHGPVTLQAHTGMLELLADQSVTFTASDDRIDVLAQQKVVLQAGQTQITLEGGDITFACPGNFTVKASQHPFLGGGIDAATLTALPIGLGRVDCVLELRYAYDDLKPVVNAPYRVLFNNGTTREGQLDDKGYARIENPPDAGKVWFGYDQREPFPTREPPANALFGFSPSSAEDAKAAIERYRAQEADYQKDNYFPDEIAAMESGDEEFIDLIGDYAYDEDVQPPVEDNDDSPGDNKEVLLSEQDAQETPA